MSNLAQSVERLKVHAAGRDWFLERTGDLEKLWDEMDQEDFGEDERLPYWAPTAARLSGAPAAATPAGTTGRHDAGSSAA